MLTRSMTSITVLLLTSSRPVFIPCMRILDLSHVSYITLMLEISTLFLVIILERANSDMLSLIKYSSIWFNYNVVFHTERWYIVGTTRFLGLQYRRNAGDVGTPFYTRWESFYTAVNLDPS